MRFEVIGEAVPKARPRRGKNGVFYTPKKTQNFENLIKLSFINAGGRMIQGDKPLKVTIEIRKGIPKSASKRKAKMMEEGTIRPTTKPDCDNYAKTIDGLNGVAWKDDSQIVELSVSKWYSREPKTIITIEEVSQDTPALPKGDESQ